MLAIKRHQLFSSSLKLVNKIRNSAKTIYIN